MQDELQFEIDDSAVLPSLRSNRIGGGSISGESDRVYTPKWAARDMVDFFKPSGRILEPCKGGGVFLELLPQAEWCEITEGRDFFLWNERVNWIITNPPYSKFAAFLRHAIRVSENVVFLTVLAKPFYSHPLLNLIHSWGGIKHIRFYGGGSRLGFPIGYACGAVHFAQGYRGATDWSWCDEENGTDTEKTYSNSGLLVVL